jgi:hypothetical protein
MNNETTLLEYRINRNGDKFMAIDSEDDVVGAYDTEDQAKREVERAKLDDAMYKHSKILIHAAIASVMNAFDVDRDRARYWVATAAEGRYSYRCLSERVSRPTIPPEW